MSLPLLHMLTVLIMIQKGLFSIRFRRGNIRCFNTADAKGICEVIATSGDRNLGGDNIDEILAQFLWDKKE